MTKTTKENTLRTSLPAVNSAHVADAEFVRYHKIALCSDRAEGYSRRNPKGVHLFS